MNRQCGVFRPAFQVCHIVDLHVVLGQFIIVSATVSSKYTPFAVDLHFAFIRFGQGVCVCVCVCACGACVCACDVCVCVCVCVCVSGETVCASWCFCVLLGADIGGSILSLTGQGRFFLFGMKVYPRKKSKECNDRRPSQLSYCSMCNI